MRYSRMQSEPPKRRSSGKGITILIVVIFVAAIVYLVAAAKTGSFLSEKIVQPIVSFFTQKDADDPTADEDEAELSSPVDGADDAAQTSPASAYAEITFQPASAYALQVGVYEDRQNAEYVAKDLKTMGGAGYIMPYDNAFRVFISAYTNKTDAENVKNRLQSEHNMESKVYDINANGFSITVETEADVIEALKEASSNISGYHAALMEIALSFDKGEITDSEAVEKLIVIRDSVNEFQTKFTAYAARTDNALISELVSYFEDLSQANMAWQEDMSSIELSSEIKSSYIEYILRYQDLCAKEYK